ncbi:MAG: hypothetical protein DSM106950_30265 [Stigonema ocellatum SAG 48.90 = DSM 106950]|nr:hypothetical protein [Stigonema ocellatum SAG 48.90 = DSM 106950]
MNDNTKKRNSHVEIDDLMDDAVNNALVRRNEALLALGDEEAESISGGASPPFPTIHGVIINPHPHPTPFPVVHGVIINPNPE